MIENNRKFSFLQWLLPLALGWLIVVLGPGSAEAKYAHIIFDAKTGKVFTQDKQHDSRHPASLTKMMTVYMVFSEVKAGRLKWEQRLKVSKRASRQPPSKLGLNSGDTISLRNATMALITRSANDMAVVIAETIAGNEAKFAARMTKTARGLGMSRTTFKNASGLPAKGQMSTARDMGVLGQALIRDFPDMYTMFNTPSFVYRGQEINNHNRLLRAYPGLDGIKTGYIRASGFNLVASAERGEHRLIGVVMGGRSAAWRDRRMQALLDYSFAELGIDRAYAAYPVDKKPRPASASDQEQDEVAASGTDAVTEDLSTAADVTYTPVEPSDSAPTAAPPTKETQASTTPEPSPPAATTSTATKPEPESWGVQVGAFRNQKLAHAAAARAKGITAVLRPANIQVSEIAQQRRRLFRARLVGIDQPAANAACATLKRQRFDCKVVRTNPSTT